ncbi:MAG TPA: signal recognition particle protein [Candidatus Binatia bacterium]|nr:signal recognition particle protein [Candidatus Binatia bacterium]
MFESLSEKLEAVFRRLRGHGKLTEKNIEEALREVRLALLEADVNFRVVKDFVDRIRGQALGQEVLASLSPEQQVIKIVNAELVTLLGGQYSELNLSAPPPVVVMLVGLNGSGKTTTAGKLARYLRLELRRSPYLIPADTYRPAAIDQLRIVAEEVGAPVYPTPNDGSAGDPVDIAKAGVEAARREGCDVAIIDTAGRLQIDEELMHELERMKAATHPHQILLVADAMTGQEAVNVASGFHARLELDGVILTKVEGDARGGAALSLRAVTGKPILFIGVGEKLDALEPFHPDRAASRILGMGDVLSLIEKAEKVYDQRQAEILEKKLRKNQFTLEDFAEQMRMLKKMGSITDLVALLPGGKKLVQGADMEAAEKEFKRIEAIISSMTKEERRKPEVLNGSRRRRIASGSGTSVVEVNRFLKQYLDAKKMMKKIAQFGGGKMGRKFSSSMWGNG